MQVDNKLLLGVCAIPVQAKGTSLELICAENGHRLFCFGRKLSMVLPIAHGQG